jgi:hypothetical protein
VNDKIILIAGDSWPAGVWEKDVNYPVHPGICSHLINLGFHVRNLAKPGGSNLESIDRVEDYISCNPKEISNIKFILFWQTEFFREVWYYRRHPLEKELAQGYAQLKDHWIYRPYYKLTELSQQWQLPIYIVGGASDTVWYDDFEKDFPGVKIVCQSITNMLINNCHRIDQPVFCEFIPGWIDEGDFLNLVKKNITNLDLKILLEDMELSKQRLKEFSAHPELFYPDGLHPNSVAHQKIFDFLIQHIPELMH